MNVNLLIDAIVRQTTVLVAELATSHGLRAPLARIADQVFIELTRELDAQGLSRKVSADMFGMALRSYQRKVQRLEESMTDRGRSLWEAVYDFIRGRPVTTRREVLERFRSDDEEIVRSVLADLVESNLVFATGPTQATSFRAASDAELGALARDSRRAADLELVWALVFRTGPIALPDLAALGRFDAKEMESALDQLVEAGRVRRREGEPVRYETKQFFVPVGSPSGWEAAVFDHFHAVVRTICSKLRRTPESSLADHVGGSTYSVEVWAGHPFADEALGTLRRFREAQSTLRERIREYNQAHQKPEVRMAVVTYGGQTVWELEGDDEGGKA